MRKRSYGRRTMREDFTDASRMKLLELLSQMADDADLIRNRVFELMRDVDEGRMNEDEIMELYPSISKTFRTINAAVEESYHWYNW